MANAVRSLQERESQSKPAGSAAKTRMARINPTSGRTNDLSSKQPHQWRRSCGRIESAWCHTAHAPNTDSDCALVLWCAFDRRSLLRMWSVRTYPSRGLAATWPRVRVRLRRRRGLPAALAVLRVGFSASGGAAGAENAPLLRGCAVFRCRSAGTRSRRCRRPQPMSLRAVVATRSGSISSSTVSACREFETTLNSCRCVLAATTCQEIRGLVRWHSSYPLHISECRRMGLGVSCH